MNFMEILRRRVETKEVKMSLKRISAAVALATLFASCTHVGTKVGNLSKGGFTTIVVDAGHGGKDNGGTSGRGSNPFQREKDLTLDTAKRVRGNCFVAPVSASL